MSALTTFGPEDQYGRVSIEGMRSLAGERRLRRIAHGRKEFFHRTKNGVYDPITYFHLIDALLEVTPGLIFRTADLTQHLNETHPQLVWDTTSVGRVISDIAETLEEVNGSRAIEFARRWNGMIYSVTADAEGRQALMNLMDDLYVLCEEMIQQEKNAHPPKRTDSPLLRCPSVAS